jgi:hypothetical protein
MFSTCTAKAVSGAQSLREGGGARTVLREALAKLALGDDAEDERRGEEDERGDGHAAEEGPLDERPAEDERVEHGRPAADEDDVEREEDDHQALHLPADRIPALVVSQRQKGRNAARDGSGGLPWRSRV